MANAGFDPESKQVHENKTETCSYTYILRCADGSLYTGWTNDLARRVAAHNAGKGAKYTRAHRPVELVYAERFSTKEEAMRRECEIKQMKRGEKMQLIERNATAIPLALDKR